MCGICGIFDRAGRPVGTEEIASMSETLRHRGPDDQGLFVNGPLGMGFRRLSIVDLSQGRQPLSNETHQVTAVCNGEIFNHQALRSLLMGRGHVMASGSDCEVIPHLYEEFDRDFVQHLNGMFAIALWDERKKRLLLIRDRLGIKPLYYTTCGDRLLFASEMKAFASMREFVADLNRDALPEYLTFGALFDERTLMKNVWELLPGTMLTADRGGIHVEEYWDVCFHPVPSVPPKDMEEQLGDLIRDAVRLQLMSDVPVGAFLSGGVDSSLVVATMSTLMAVPVQTFSVAFAERDCNELPYARTVAEHFHTDHTELLVAAEEFFQLLPEMIYFNDEPLAHPAFVPLYLLAESAKKQGVSVLLSGEGADELFAGYDGYRALRRDVRLTEWVPGAAWTLLGSLLGGTEAGLVQRYRLPRENLLAVHVGTHFEKQLFLSDIQFPDLTNHFVHLVRKNGSGDPLTDLLYLHTKTRLLSLLLKQDKATMAASVETRVPYLDHRLVEFAGTIPGQLKMDGRKGKVILKSVAGRILPRSIVHRKKMGFPVPLGRWLRDGNSLAILAERRCQERGLVNSRHVQEIIAAHRQGRGDYSLLLWRLLNLEQWIRIRVEGDFAAVEHSRFLRSAMNRNGNGRVTAVISAKNEEGIIAQVVQSVKSHVDEVVVVDGHSHDLTAARARDAGARVVWDDGTGKGNAIKKGIAESDGDIIVFLDADGSHDVADIPKLVAPISSGKADLVMASREKGGSDEHRMDFDNFVRQFGCGLAALLVNYRWNVRLTDVENGFRAIRRAAAQSLRLKTNDFDIEQEMLMRCLKKGYRIREIASHEHERAWGRSKLKTRKAWKFLWSLAREMMTR